MNEYPILVLMLAHFASYGLVARQVNSRVNDERSPERIAMFFVGPRSLANLWKLLLGMGYLRTGDRVLIASAVVHTITTTVVIVMLAGWLIHDVFA